MASHFRCARYGLLAILLCAGMGLTSTPAYALLHETTFPNGVKLIVEEDHAAPVAMVQVWIKVGGRDELPGKTGLAHVMEHMMFKGSKALGPGEFSRRIALMGGNDNAFTTHDYTAYFETVPSNKVDEVLSMELERFTQLKLDAKEFGREIEVIKEERRMRTEDDPNSRMFEELASVALRVHPYRNPVIGWMEDLNRLTVQDVRSFYLRHYVAGNVILVVVGDVDAAHIQQQVAKTFGQLPRRPIPPRFNPKEGEPLGPKRLQVKLPAELPLLAIATWVPVWKPGKNDREVAALAVATEMLAGGRSALLKKHLVDDQRIAFSTGAGYDPFSMGLDLWYFYASLAPGQKPQAAENAFWHLVRRIQNEPVDETALAAAKRRIVAEEVFASDSLYLRAKRIGQMEAVGIGAKRWHDWLKAIREVKGSDVRKVLQRWIRPERSTTGILTPTGSR